MGYMHIDNLYKNQSILAFRECYALEKIHGTSAHVQWVGGEVRFFAGGENHERFVGLFDALALAAKFAELSGPRPITVFGEAYGGKQQGMKATYGDALRFIAFDVGDEGIFLDVERAAAFVAALGLEFVHWRKLPTDLAVLDAERDADSVQAVRNGTGAGHKREGIVLRPPFEVRLNCGARVIAKHKRAEFAETKTPREVNPAEQAVLADAQRIADEWVTPMRLAHVAARIGATGIEQTGDIIRAMIEDVIREAGSEIVDSKAARKAIGSVASKLWKQKVCAVLKTGTVVPKAGAASGR